MSGAPSPDNESIGQQQGIHEVLTGRLGARYGAIPVIPMPQENELIIGFVQSLAHHLKGKGLYRRDRLVMIPNYEQGRLVIMSDNHFCVWSQKYVVTSKEKRTKDGEIYTVMKDMPTDSAKKTLESDMFVYSLGRIDEVHGVPMPKLSGGNISLMESGYDEELKVFTFNPYQTQNTHDCPYYEWSLEESRDYLRELLSEFPFADISEDGNSRSLAVQIAAMLSQFCCSMLPPGASRMGIIYNANSQRSGKSLLAKIAITPVHGPFTPSTWKSNEDELNKVIDSAVLAGQTYLCFDNVRGYLASQTLEAIMTAPEWTGRILGKTEMFRATNRLTLFVTGNDCILSPDLDHRTLLCDLYVPEGDVQTRQPSLVIDDTWLMDWENRKRILSALWGLVRSWHAVGMPTATSFGFKPRLGFERWGDLVGGIVGHAGFGNCLERPVSDTSGDSESRNIRKMIQSLMAEAIHDRQEFTFQKIVNICHDNDIFDWMLDGRTNQEGDFVLSMKSKSKFGLTLARYAPNIDNLVGKSTPREPRRYIIDEKEVLFGCEGQFRHKRYFIQQPSGTIQ
jgi:hypothetical protein